jgi:predicted O-methyltransferase YrrM
MAIETLIARLRANDRLRRIYRAIRPHEDEQSPFVTFCPPGHYYSALPSWSDFVRIRDRGIEIPRHLNGIDMNDDEQLRQLDRISGLADDVDIPEHPTEGWCYYHGNGYYAYGDGIVLQAMMRMNSPKRIIEIGSGYSSALMIDINDKYFDGNIEITLIEPFPERLHDLVGDKLGRFRLLSDIAQNVAQDTMDELESGDMLFIDSSHVVKLDSDLVHIFFRFLPRLKRGVLVHFHDIFWPFEYPLEWSAEGKSWNELYFLRALLMDTTRYEVVFMSDYLNRFFEEQFVTSLKCSDKFRGYHLWLRVVG